MIKKLFLFSLLFTSKLFAHSPDQLIFKMKNKFSPELSSDVVSVKKLFNNYYIVNTYKKDAVIAEFKNAPEVESIEVPTKAKKRMLPVGVAVDLKNLQVDPNSIFNDPLINQVWSFNEAAKNGVSVKDAYAQNQTEGTTTTIVAVVDTGVDYNHEELKSVMWKNEKEIPGNGIDDDGNGYVDDVYGINTLIRDEKGNATVEIKDTHSHGTHVSGTIGARQNNNKGIAGIASNVKIIGLRVVPNDGDETDVNVAEAFIYAAQNGAKIINCSFGKYENEGGKLIPDTIKYIGEKYGVLVVAAAGNESSDLDSKPSYPAAFDNENLLVVASTSSTGGLSYFSNFGKTRVDVAAPGSNIYSTVPNNKYESMSGTSMATPTTVGVLAEILSHYPTLGPVDLKNVLMNSVTKVDRFKNKMVSGGRIDLLNALEYAKSYKH